VNDKLIDMKWDRVNARFEMVPPTKVVATFGAADKIAPSPTAAELQFLSDRPGNKWYGPRPGGRGTGNSRGAY